MRSNFTVMPYSSGNIQHISFVGTTKPDKSPNGEAPFRVNKKKPPTRNGPLGNMTDISFFVRKQINEESYKKGISNDEYLRSLMKCATYTPVVMPVDSKSAIVGNTRVHTLIDGGQIFDKTIEYLKSAEKSIQVEMFEFQNLTVDGEKWAQNGAEKVPGAKEQQDILWLLVKKKQANPEMKIQVILDAHKWYMDGHGDKTKHFANQDMIKFLKKKGIDVVPYPRASQQGAALQHVKLVAVDGKKLIMGGMNWGTHSAANHDACVAIENLPTKKNSEVDNVIEEIFNTDWKFAWQRIGETELAPGPLCEADQQYYKGMNKEIKKENVDYVNLLKDFYDTDEAKQRYSNNDLELIKTNPVENPKIAVLATKPKELELVGKAGLETTREVLMDKIKTCKKLRAELFVLTDKELVKTVIKRVKAGELDAKFIVEPSIIEQFPYCENAYDELKENDIPVRIYKVDKSVNQRMHSKWAVFDDKEVMIGSTNWSAMGLNQNLKTGKRDDYDLNTGEIDNEIKDYFKAVKEHEKKLQIPSLSWDGGNVDHKNLKDRLKVFRTAINELNKKGETSLTLNGKKYSFVNDDKLTAQSSLQTIQGYYGIIKDRHNAKEKFKRGNNEAMVLFESPSLAKNVFVKQFDRDWQHSDSKYDKAKLKEFPIRQSENLDIEG